MSRFSKVAAAVWRSKRFKALATDQAKLLYHYYLTCEHQTSIGAFALPDGYALDDLAWEKETYLAARALLVAAGLIVFDEDTSTLYVERWFKHSPPMNDSHAKACIRLIGELEAAAIREKVEADFIEANNSRNPPPPPAVPFPQRVSGAERWPVRVGSGR